MRPFRPGGHLALALLALRERRGRILGLALLALLFLAGAAATALLARDPHGGFALDRLFQAGGLPLASGALLMGWALGRFPLVATIVLTAGVVSGDRVAGHARILAARPRSPLAVYGTRLAVLGLLAFALSALLLPAFDLLLLGRWAGPATLVLVLGTVLAYGSLVALLSVWTRGDAWVAVLLAGAAFVWHALLRAGVLAGLPPGGRRFITLVLPPQGALYALETAFADVQPIPWAALGYTAVYAAAALALAAVSLLRREI